MVGQNSYEHDNHQPTTSGEIPVELLPYLLSPERLEKLKKYVAFYLAKYGKEAEAPTQESEGGK